MTLINPAPQQRVNPMSNCDTAAALPIKEFAAKIGAKSAVLRPSAVKQTLQVHFTDAQGNTMQMPREGLRPLALVATPGPSLSARIAGTEKGKSVDLADTVVAPIYEGNRINGFSLFLQGEVKYGEVFASVSF